MSGVIIGDNWKNVGKPQAYFRERNCFIDCRGSFIVARSSVWGFNVTVLTASHDISKGIAGEVTFKEVIVENNVWIASNVVLYNCRVREGAVVSVGAVVRNMTVPAHTMVEGNPARVIKKFNGEKWIKLDQSST